MKSICSRMSNTVSPDVRFEYYKSPTFKNCNPGSINLAGLNVDPDNPCTQKELLSNNYVVSMNRDLSTHIKADKHALDQFYTDHMRKLIEQFKDTSKINFPIYYMTGDTRGQEEFFYPLFAKARQFQIASNPEWNQLHVRNMNLPHRATFPHQPTLLKCFNQHRHWHGGGQHISVIRHSYDETIRVANTLKFKHKFDRVVWRGISTGAWIPLEHNQRVQLVKKYFHHPDMNIGFERILPGHSATDPSLNNLIKPKLSGEQMIQHKYIVSIHGNDKDSGLNWKLQTDSVVLMPEPYIESWLMEGLLEPGVHYVLLKDDLSDLPEKLQWCRDNQHECERISHNATEFMRQFWDHDQEIQLQHDLLSWGSSLIDHG